MADTMNVQCSSTRLKHFAPAFSSVETGLNWERVVRLIAEYDGRLEGQGRSHVAAVITTSAGVLKTEQFNIR